MLLTKLKIYLNAIRFFNPHGTILLFLPCLITFAFLNISSDIPLKTYFIFFLGAFFIRSVSCLINDFFDKKYDQKVKRTYNRPFASGQISKLEMIILSFLLLLLAFVCLLQLNVFAIKLGFLAPLLFVTYPLFKRFTYFPQLFLALCMSYGVLMAAAEINLTLSLDIWLLFSAIFFWVFAYDTIYAYQDIEDDITAGVKSSALYFKGKGKYYIFGSFILFLLLILIVGFKNDLGFLFFILLNILAFYILSRIQYLDLSDSEACFVEFKQNIYYGIFIAILVFIS